HAQGLAAKLRSGRILLGGHRGNADECPENTLTSFRSAIELGVDVIELDVHRSEDGGLAVIHDHLLDRTTDGSGLVRDYTMAELKRLDAGSWKDPRFKGERIPSLDEVLALAKGQVGVWRVESVFSLTWSKALPANAIYTNKPRETRP